MMLTRFTCIRRNSSLAERRHSSLLARFFCAVLIAGPATLSAQQKQSAAVNRSPSPSSVNRVDAKFWDSVGGGKAISLYNGKVPNSKAAPATYKETYDKAWSRKVTDP